MIIGISALGPIQHDTGGRTYLVNLSKTLQRIVTTDNVIFFVSHGQGQLLQVRHPDFKIIEIPFSLRTSYHRIFAEHIILPFYIKKHKIDIMYFPGNFSSYVCPVPYVLAIRSMLAYNENKTQSVNVARNFYRKILIPHSAKNAVNIITPSQHTKDEIVRYLQIPASKIRTIPHGIDLELFASHEHDTANLALFERYQVVKPFLIYVSALWEYKNQDKLIEAFHWLILNKQIPHQLVLVGRGMNSYESYAGKLKQMVKNLQLTDRVRFIDFLPHEELRYFYQQADIMVFPSSIESFGNSIFEAMAAGTPVVCSNTHGFPAMIKDAALTVNPYNIEELALAVFEVLTSTSLQSKLINNGKNHVKSLSWSTCIDQTLSLIKSSV